MIVFRKKQFTKKFLVKKHDAEHSKLVFVANYLANRFWLNTNIVLRSNYDSLIDDVHCTSQYSLLFSYFSRHGKSSNRMYL